MNDKQTSVEVTVPTSADKRPTPPVEARILRLVQGAPERRALARGEVDAIIDPASGLAILLPDAQAALIDLKRHFRSLVNLASDGIWEQDEQYRFTACSGTALGAATVAEMLGHSLWDLAFVNCDAADWSAHRAQLEHHTVFRDLELCHRDAQGRAHYLSISGEPKFDAGGRFSGYRGITRDITSRRTTDTDRAHSVALQRATLNALMSPACLLSEDGVIVDNNTSWRTWAELPGAGVAVGSHYLSACTEHRALVAFDSAAMAAGLAQVASGERALFRFEHGFNTEIGPRWLMVSVSSLRAPGVSQLLIVHEDVSEQKRSAQWLALESTVAARLARATDATAGIRAVLAAVCEAQRWDCGQYFEHDASTASLGHVAQWSEASAAEVEKFLAKSPSGRFRADAGLAGRVCQANQPLWLRDAHNDARGASALPHEIGLRGVFIFPVSVDGALFGVLAFGSRNELSEPDESCLRSVASIGNLLGHFLRRETELTRLRRSEQRFRRYTALGSDWHWETDSEGRFVATTAAGIGGVGDLLGKRLWELPHLRVSDGEWTRLKAEIAAQWSFCDFECAAKLSDGREARYYLSGEPVFDESGTFSGFVGIGLDITQRAR